MVGKKERRILREFEREEEEEEEEQEQENLPPYFVRERHEGTSHRHTGTGKSKNTPSSGLWPKPCRAGAKQKPEGKEPI